MQSPIRNLSGSPRRAPQPNTVQSKISLLRRHKHHSGPLAAELPNTADRSQFILTNSCLLIYQVMTSSARCAISRGCQTIITYVHERALTYFEYASIHFVYVCEC